MRCLLDTNAWIFFFQDAPELSSRAADVIEAETSCCFVSVVSLWEAAIKVGRGKLTLPYDIRSELPDLFERNGIKILALSAASALAVRDLPPLHGDPFDRIQVCQALEENLTVISRDPVFDTYSLRRIW